MAYPLVQPGRLLLQQHVPMRDGVRLAADVWLPPASFGAGPFPTLVARSQHGTERYLPWVLRFTHESGYACVLQDVRGRGDSDGANPWPAYVTEESDGFDTLRWAHEAPWCSGQIGMFGYSYSGFTQSMAALGSPTGLLGTAPTASQQDNYGHWRVDGVLHWCV
eukprot:COSAG01_NODE_27664_length_680_cov_0.790017_1_plen_163_part_01